MIEILECGLIGGYCVMAGYFWRAIESSIEEARKTNRAVEYRHAR